MNPNLKVRFDSLKSSGSLPSPKGPALTVVQLTRQDNVSSAQLARAIQADPALVARLLKLANACQAPGGRPILAIKSAISILGLTSVRGLALGFSLMTDKQALRCRGFNYTAFWSRNLARAVAMQALAASSRLMQSDEAFTLGLLSHIGELGLASAFPEDYAQLLGHQQLSGMTILAQERQAFEFDHADLTSALMADWGFPAGLTEPVGFHEQPDAASFAAGSRSERLLFTLVLASQIADVCMAAKPRRRAMMAELFLLGGKLSIGAEELMKLCDSIVHHWTDWCRLLDVPTETLPPFAELMNAPPAPSLENANGLSNVMAADGFRVLVVDDDRSIRLILKSLLTKAGYTCSEAASGREGLEQASTELPDMMIVDWMMPEMDGIELIRTLRQTESGRAIYILLLTGLDQEERLIEAFAAGADDFLSKPLKSNVLTARLVAGQRVVTLQREMKRDLNNLQSFATEFANLNLRLQEGYQKDLVNQKRMELALDGGNLGMWDLHIPSREVVFSERGCALLGYRPDEIKPDVDSWRQLAHPDDWAVINAALQAHLKGESASYECEHRIRHKDGRWVWILDRGRVVEWDAAGAPLRAVGTLMDITERKEAEEKIALREQLLMESESRFRAMADSAPVLIWVSGVDKLCNYFNKVWLEFTGRSIEQEMGNGWAEGVHPEDLQRCLDTYVTAFDARREFAMEYRLRRFDGEYRWLIDNGVPRHEDQGDFMGYIGSCIDITERKQTEQRLGRLLAEQKALLENELVGIVTVRDRTIVWANPAFEKMLGYAHGELAGTPTRNNYPSEEAYLAFGAAAYPVLTAGKLFRSQFEHVRKDGSHIWLDVSGAFLDRETGETLWGFTDISEHVRTVAELNRSNAELEQFSYAISHDMRQPLRMVSSYMQLLEKSLANQLDAEQRGYFDFAIDGAKRMDTMMLGLLEYSRVGRKGEPPASIESRGVLDEALLFLQPAIAEAQANVDIEGEWPRILVSLDEMLRLIQNLIGNALKFRVTGRTPKITVTSKAADNEWRLCVTDNGIGILPDQMDRLFQVFQRLQSRADYEGTGIGLALCRKIAEHHGGRIWAESEGEGKGSCFVFAMPLREEGNA